MFNLLAALLDSTPVPTDAEWQAVTGMTWEETNARIETGAARLEPDTTMPPPPTTEALEQLGIDPDWYAQQFTSNPWIGPDGRLID